MKLILAPSILSADFSCLGTQIRACEESGAQYVHFDVMDGMFVPNISFGIPVLKSVRKITDSVIDVHLMIQDPIRYIREFADAGADIITFHFEACEDVQEVLDEIHACGKKAGIVIKPDTSVKELFPYIGEAEMFLIMTVEPGFGGQKLIPESLWKIAVLREELNARGKDADIEVDGGVTFENVEDVLNSGANVIVAGSAVYKGDIQENVKTFMEIMKNYE